MAEASVPHPRISVVIPTFNRSGVILGAVESALRQIGPEHEVVVVDDGSTDSTLHLLSSIDDPRLRVLEANHYGVAAARNRGVHVASGDWIALLDSDDTMMPGALAALHGAVSSGVGLVTAVAEAVTSDGAVERWEPVAHGPEFRGVTGLFLAGTMLVRRDLWLGIGGQLEGLVYSENSEFAMRLCDRLHQLGLAAVCLDVPTVRIRHRESARVDDRQRAAAAELVLCNCRAQLGRSPRARATYLAMSGVHHARAGETAAAARAFGRAWLAHPAGVRNLVRLAVMGCRPVRRRIYGPTAGSAA